MVDSQEEIIYQIIKQYMEASGQSATARPEPRTPNGGGSGYGANQIKGGGFKPSHPFGSQRSE